MQKLLLLLLFTCAASSTLFAQKTWTGASNTNWTTDDNWAPWGVPTSTDSITIPAGTTNSPIIPAGPDVEYLKITIDSGASLTVEANAYVVSSASPYHSLSVHGKLTNYGIIVATNDWPGDEPYASAVEIRNGVVDNYGTLAARGAINIGIMVFSGDLNNFPGGLVYADNSIGMFVFPDGTVKNESGSEIQIKGLSAGIIIAGSFTNAGKITCEGDVKTFDVRTENLACASFTIQGSLEVEGNTTQGFENAGLTVITETLTLQEGFFMNRGILKYKTLEAAAPQFLQKLSDAATHTGSAVISDESGLTITESGVGTGLEVLGVFLNAELTRSAGTYGGDGLQLDPTLPIGYNSLFLQMTINHTECKYVVPILYYRVPVPGTWIGGTSDDWNLPDNWSDGVVPGPTTNIFFPENSLWQPVIRTSDAFAHDITMGPGVILNLNEFAAIQISGNVTGTGVFSADAPGASVYFSGTSPQTIPGGLYYMLSVGGANKTFTGNAKVSSYVFFSGTTKIALGNNTLTLADGIIMSGAGAGTYFITNGTGGLKKNNVGFDEFTFPVGTETSYTPVVFANQGSADNFTVRVGEGAFSSYLDNNPQGSPVSSMVVNKTWYISEDVPGGSSAILQLYWNATDELSSFDRNLCFISHYKSTGWDPTAASQAFGADPYYKRRASITSFSPFVVTNPGSPLPVTLTRFDAAREGSTALLSWSTSSETNSDRFEIERSVNGKDWLQIGSVRSQGESKELVDYQFVDLNPIFSAENLYRLRMIDRSAIGTDATFAYSRIRSLNFKDFDRRIVYPNPANDQLFINNPGHVSHVRILDLKGNVVLDFGKIDGHGIRVNQLTPGIHVVEVDWFDGSKTTQKVLINR